MQDKPQLCKRSPTFIHIQKMLLELIKQFPPKYQTLILTTRTSQIVYSILSEQQILSCGYQKIIQFDKINPYMQYEDAVLIMSLSGGHDFEEISQFAGKVDKVYLINLGVSNIKAKQKLKKLQFKQKNSIKGYKQENLDFVCYLQNVFTLSELHKRNDQNKKNKIKKIQENQQIAIDRLCSYLCSFENFKEFEFYFEKRNDKLSELIKGNLQDKIAVLSKYGYKGIGKNKGMISVRTRVIVLERTEMISPFVLSLYYGPLVEQLSVGKSCQFVSCQSILYNTLYSMDLLTACNLLTFLLEGISQGKQKKVNPVNFLQTKKLLDKTYNPDLSKEELSFHQTLITQLNLLMQKNVQALILQQSIANKINQNGQLMRGSKIIEQIYKWCNEEKNKQKYDRYLGLVTEAFTVHSFWWFQKNELLAGISDKNDHESVQTYTKRVKIHSLKQKPPTIEVGVQVRQNCFRHKPHIIDSLNLIGTEIKEKKENLNILKVNWGEVGSLAKKIRTIVYINGPVGFNQICMLNGSNQDNNYQFVCQSLVNTKQWTDHILQNL